MPISDLENIIGKLALEKAGEKFLNALEDEAVETFLEVLSGSYEVEVYV